MGKFSRNTFNKPKYRTLWHPKYAQEMKTKKEPAFSFKLAMGCFKAISLKVLVTIELLISSRKHNTKKQQSQIEAGQDVQKAIAPIVCSTSENGSDKIAETQVSPKFNQSDRTFMKCCVGLTLYLAYRVFILKLKLIKQEIKQKLESLFIPEIKTSETKFQEIRRARRKNSYFYHGIEVSSRSGLTRRGDELINLKPRTKVKISFEFVRLTLSPLTSEALSKLIEHYALDINKQHLAEISQRIEYLFKVGMDLAASEARIDHTDMLWLPVVWQVNQSPGFKFAQRVMVDEAQDMSRLQLEFVLSLAHKKAKMLFVV